jgi:hypothetical protein
MPARTVDLREAPADEQFDRVQQRRPGIGRRQQEVLDGLAAAQRRDQPSQQRAFLATLAVRQMASFP